MICKNCGSEFNGNFCNNCGQKHIEKRFTIKEILHDFFHALTHVDSGLLFLIKELFLHPGIVVKEYIDGKRKKYFNPLQFLIITVAISTFAAINFGLLGPKFNVETINSLSGFQKYMAQFNIFIYKFFNIILFISVPNAALYSRFVFKNSGYNYAENLIFNSFIAGQRNIIYLLISPLIYAFKSNYIFSVGTYYVLWNAYFIFAYMQFFGGNKFITSLKYICVLILMFITNQGISMLIFTLFFYDP